MKNSARLRLALFAGLGLLSYLAGPAAAGTGAGWELTADRLDRDDSADVVVATGQVVMVQQAAAGEKGAKLKTIKADWLRYDRRHGLVEARGQALLDSPEERITAETAELDLNRDTGRLTGATLYFPLEQLYLEGREVEKTGEFTYHLLDGWASKCQPVSGQASPWSFGWAEGDVTLEGFAHFQQATFRVKDQPIVYSPYMAFPTNRQRKSGFLLPELSASTREGSGIIVPYYFNLSPAHDLTLYGGSYGQRGGVMASEFRYRWAEHSQGVIAFDYLHDQTVDTPGNDYKSDGILRTAQNRYWLRGKGDHDFGGALLGKADIDLVSDRDYLQEFNSGELGFDESEQRFQRAFGRGFYNKTNPLRDNSLQLAKFWPAMALSSELRLVQDPTEIAAAAQPWTLPRLNFSGQMPFPGREKRAASPVGALFRELEFDWESEYLRYWRKDGVGYHRGHLSPKVETPIPLSPYLELVASAGIDQTWYKVDGANLGDPVPGEQFPSRTLGNFQVTASTTWVRDFALDFEGYGSLSHMIRPTLAYTSVTTQEQTALPNLDELDRIGGQRLLTYGFDNDLDLFGAGSNGRLNTRKYANIKLFQSYDLGEGERPLSGVGDEHRPWSPLDLELTLNPWARYSLNYKTLVGVHGEGVTRYEFNTNLTTSRQDHLALGYRYDRVHGIAQINTGVTVKLSSLWMFDSSIAHSLATQQTVEGMIRLLYLPACWNMELKLAVSPDNDYRATLVFGLEGIGKVFGFNQTPASALPGIGG